MALPTSSSPEFANVERAWHFERLCQDLAAFKDSKSSRSLTERECDYLRGLLLGYSPQQISRLVTGSENSSSARNTLSTRLYPWLKELIQAKSAEAFEPSKSHGRHLVLLERLGYRKALIAPGHDFWADDDLDDWPEDGDGKQLGGDRSQ